MTTFPASMGEPLNDDEVKELRRAIELGYAMRHELVEKALNERDQALSRVGVLEGQLAAAQSPILGEIAAEQAQQEAKFGEQNHVDGTGPYVKNPDRMTNMEDQSAVARLDCQEAAEAGRLNWMLILREEIYEAFAEEDPAALRTELVQVAAVAATWVEAIDRRTSVALGLDGGGTDAE